ncbi:hypothetical protein, partial [Collinsella tanakaei]|uniref:hypothetical protein n=1 Tax=Collinsella tanakaei TaxID=626935 RepID=UPI0019578207
MEVTYSTNAPNQQDGSGGGGGTTLGGKVVWNIGTEQIQVPMYRDLDDVPVVSSNGLLFSSPLMVNRSILV